MSRVVRGALVQASWTGDKESMIQKHEQYAHEAAKQGAQNPIRRLSIIGFPGSPLDERQVELPLPSAP